VSTMSSLVWLKRLAYFFARLRKTALASRLLQRSVTEQKRIGIFAYDQNIDYSHPTDFDYRAKSMCVSKGLNSCPRLA
jgi:hypothetical protein